MTHGSVTVHGPGLVDPCYPVAKTSLSRQTVMMQRLFKLFLPVTRMLIFNPSFPVVCTVVIIGNN